MKTTKHSHRIDPKITVSDSGLEMSTCRVCNRPITQARTPSGWRHEGTAR